MANHESSPQDPEETPPSSTDLDFHNIIHGAGIRVSYFKQLRQVVRDKRHAVAKQVTNHINPILAAHDNFAYFETYADDSAYRILALRKKYTLLGHQTLIAINQERSPEPDEDFFPDGRILKTTDMIVGKSHNPLTRVEFRLDYVSEKQARDQRDHRPLTPAKTTLVVPRRDGLHVFGNLKKYNLSLFAHSTDATPQETKQLEADNLTLTGIMRTLTYCNEHNLNEEYTGLRD